MIRARLAQWSLMGWVLLMACASSGRAECVVPWGVIRTDSKQCAARIRIRDEQGVVRVCLARVDYLRWLEQEQPVPWEISSGSSLRWIRPPALDQPAGPVQRWVTAELGSSCEHGRVAQISLFLIQTVERQREFWSSRVAEWDPSGWLRGWVVGERVSERHETLPASVLFSLGFVHLLTSAGVHLIFLSKVFRAATGWVVDKMALHWGPRQFAAFRRSLVVVEGFLFLWVWMLSGMRWGMLRPLLLVALSRAFSRYNWAIRAPVPLLVAVGLEFGLELITTHFGWGLAPDSEFVSHGRLHYLAAVWGGVWGARHLEVSVGSWLWVLPLQLLHDGSLSLMNPILSLITIPIAGVLLLPLSLLGMIFPGLIPVVGWLSQLTLAVMVPLSVLPGVNWQVRSWALVPAALGAAVVFFYGVRRAFWVVLVLAGILAIRTLPLAPQVGARVLQLDVGQGDSALILSEGRAGFVDAGPERSASQSAWLSLFSRQGITQLDWVVLTHLDEDHSGGLKRWVRWIPIRCIVVPPALWSSRKGVRWREWARRWQIRMQPYPEGCFPFGWAALQGPPERANSGMVGVRIPLEGGREYWNLGDASSQGVSREEELVELLQHGSPPVSHARKILKLSHHGSKHSSDLGFLKRFGPEEVWISSGYSNRYGHPHREVLERLSILGIPWKATASRGVLELKH